MSHQRSSKYVEDRNLSEGNMIQQNYHREFVSGGVWWSVAVVVVVWWFVVCGGGCGVWWWFVVCVCGGGGVVVIRPNKLSELTHHI